MYEIRTMESHPYGYNEPRLGGTFNTGSGVYETSQLPPDFAFFTPEIIRRVHLRITVPTQAEFEEIVYDIAHEYARQSTQ